MERRISDIVTERPSYGTRRLTAMIRHSGSRTVVVVRPNIMWETDFTKIYIEGEGWVHLTALLDLCSSKIRDILYPVCPEMQK